MRWNQRTSKSKNELLVMSYRRYTCSVISNHILQKLWNFCILLIVWYLISSNRFDNKQVGMREHERWLFWFIWRCPEYIHFIYRYIFFCVCEKENTNKRKENKLNLDKWNTVKKHETEWKRLKDKDNDNLIKNKTEMNLDTPRTRFSRIFYLIKVRWLRKLFEWDAQIYCDVKCLKLKHCSKQFPTQWIITMVRYG